jgi:MoxR-like ATPase
MPLDRVAAKFGAIVDVIREWIYDKEDVVRLAALGLIAPGNLLVFGVAGNGMTALGKGVAAAIGGRVVSVDGRTGLAPEDVAQWSADDVVLISHFDGLTPAQQVAVIEAGERPALVLAKCNPLPERAPHPPDDEIRDRFMFGAPFGYVDVPTEMRIIAEFRGGHDRKTTSPAVSREDLAAIRAAVAVVDVPSPIRRLVAGVSRSTRDDPDVLLPASTVATLDLVRAACGRAASQGRPRVTTTDVRAVAPGVFGHRLVLAPGSSCELADVIRRCCEVSPA